MSLHPLPYSKMSDRKTSRLLVGSSIWVVIWFVIWCIVLYFFLLSKSNPGPIVTTVCNVTNPILDVTTRHGFANLSYYLENQNVNLTTFKPGQYSTLIIPWTAAYNSMVMNNGTAYQLQVTCFYVFLGDGQLSDLYESQVTPSYGLFAAMFSTLCIWVSSAGFLLIGLCFFKCEPSEKSSYQTLN